MGDMNRVSLKHAERRVYSIVPVALSRARTLKVGWWRRSLDLGLMATYVATGENVGDIFLFIFLFIFFVFKKKKMLKN